jgi:ferredoxin
MATPEERLPENVPGAFYVTSECIDCDLCRESAPTVYRRNDEIGLSIVHHQPETAEERAQAIEGMEGCPVEAIGCTEAIEAVK